MKRLTMVLLAVGLAGVVLLTGCIGTPPPEGAAAPTEEAAPPEPASAPEVTPTPMPEALPPEEAPPEVTPPEEESTTPILAHGTNRWRLKATTFGEQEIEKDSGYSGQVYKAIEGHVFLQAEFENLSEVDLIDAWDLETTGGEMPDLFEIYLIEGIRNVYVTDSQGNMYPAVILGASKITFAVPYDGHGFTLYFLDCAPIELGH